VTPLFIAFGSSRAPLICCVASNLTVEMDIWVMASAGGTVCKIDRAIPTGAHRRVPADGAPANDGAQVADIVPPCGMLCSCPK
jgi:hypothetical protein